MDRSHHYYTLKMSILYTLMFLVTVVEAKPHIVFMVADDYGWNDVGFHNPDIITPHIDKLAYGGVILNQSYVQPVCSPSRHAFMTGIYPFKSGLQHLVIKHRQATCSPLSIPFLSEYLKKLGYATHIVGKWHLGFCRWECTPTYRGFDTFYGFYNGREDYYNRSVFGGYDFRDGEDAILPDRSKYSTYIFAERAKQLISRHDKEKPFFLYFPFQSPHEPIEVPAKYENMYSNIKNEGRRKYSGMVTAMDDMVGAVVTALKDKGMYDDTLFVFTADNGGAHIFHASNYPLRGAKVTVYEGGTRAVAFISGAGLKKTGYTYNGMMHAVDWMPTILSAAGGKPETCIDGIDLWENLRSGCPSKRTEFIYNLDDTVPPITGHAAIRVCDYKLIEGSPGPYPDWYEVENGTSDLYRHEREQFQKDGTIPMDEYETCYSRQLFNLKDDPYERHDLSLTHWSIADALSRRMAEYHAEMVTANFPEDNPASDPKLHNGFWSPGWC